MRRVRAHRANGVAALRKRTAALRAVIRAATGEAQHDAGGNVISRSGPHRPPSRRRWTSTSMS